MATTRACSKTITINGSHATSIAHPAAVAKVIEQAAGMAGKD